MILTKYLFIKRNGKMKETKNNINSNNRIKTNWYVITGGPSSGKTTTVNLLKERGYLTTFEHARHYIDTQRLLGKTIEEIKKHQREFQLGILDMQIVQESQILPDILVFLDRAIPDTLAYCRFLDLQEEKKLTEAMLTVFYKKVFILDCLPVVKDYARTEDEAAQKKIHSLLVQVYESLGSPIVHVPLLSPEERVDFILKNL